MRELLETELLEILSEFSDALPERDTDNVRELLLVGEYAVGFETLCTQLYEYDIHLSPSQFAKLASLGERMKLDRETWQILESLANE